MSAFELIKLGRMLHHAGIVSREKDTMDLMMILPDGYELDIIKFTELLKARYGYDWETSPESLESFMIRQFGESFTAEFERIAI